MAPVRETSNSKTRGSDWLRVGQQVIPQWFSSGTDDTAKVKLFHWHRLFQLCYEYRIAQKFRGSKFSRIAVFENFVEIISRIHCPEHATPTSFMSVHVEISRALELLFIDLAAAVNTRNLEGMPTFDVQAMARGYHVYQHVWDASIHEELPCAREADNLRDPLSERSFRIRQLRPWILSIHSFEVLKHSHLAVHDRKSLKTIMHVSKISLK